MPKRSSHEPNNAKSLEDSRLALDGSVVPIGYVSLDIDGRVLDVNPKWYEILGYARDEVRGQRFEEFVASPSRDLFNQQFRELPIRGEVANLELSMLRKDGSHAAILFSGSVERDAAGKVQRIHSFLNDLANVVTPQQTLDRSEGRFRQLFNHMSSCAAVYEARQAGEDFVLVDFNETAERAEKVTRADVVGRSVLEAFPGVRDFGLFDVLQRVWRTGIPEHHPVAQYQDKRIRGWRENYVCKLPSGELIAIYDDVTERKQVEQTLENAAREWQATFDASNDAIWLLDTENRITRCNLRAERLFRIPRTQQIGKHCWEVVHKTTAPFPECPLLDARESLDRETLVLPLDERWLEIIVDPVLDEQGQYRGAVHTIRDITKEHEAARLLRESEERFRVISRASREDIWQLDLAGKVTYASPAVKSVFGYTPEEARHLGFDAFFPAYELPRATEAFTNALSGSELQILDLEGLHKDGSVVPIEVTVTPIVDGNSVTGVQGVAKDITERKRSESQMLATQRFLDSVIDQSPFAMWVSDANGTIIRTNHTLRESLGLTNEQIVGLYNVFEDVNLEKQDVMPQVRAVFDKLEPTRFSISWKAKDAGSTDFANAHDLHLDVSMFPIVAPDGQLSNVVCQWADVTQRVRAQELLIDSEQSIQRKLDAILSPDDEGREGIELRDLLDVESIQALMDDFYATTDIGMAILSVAGEILVSTGLQGICTKFHRIHPETLRHCAESDTILTQDVELGSFKLHRCKNGMWDTATPIELEGRRLGNLFLGQFLFEDEIPDQGAFRRQAQRYGFDEVEYLAALERVPRWSRKTVETVMSFYTKLAALLSGMGYGTVRLARSLARQEEMSLSLQASRDQYQQLVENLNDAVFVLDAGRKITYVSPVAEELTGYAVDELVGLSLCDVIASEDLALVEQSVASTLSGNSEQIEFRFLMKDGTKRWSRASSRPNIEDGRSVGVTGVFSDISEQRKARDALRISEEKYRLLFENMMNGFALHEIELDASGTPVDYVFLEANQAFEEITGLRREDLVGKRITEALPAIASETAGWIARYGAVVLTGQEVRFEEYSELFDKWFSVLAFPVQERRFATMFEDVTSKKKAESSLQAHAVRLRALASQLGKVQEEERRRLSRELHDQVGQNLTALAMRIDGTLEALRSGRDIALHHLEGAQELVDECIRTIRDVMANLRPSILDDYGLAAALSSYHSWFNPPETLRILVDVTPPSSRLPTQTETAMFRIAQEALANVLKHARASEVHIRLSEQGDMTQMCVEDNGIGFVTGLRPGSEAHWGQLIMRERAEAEGGTLTVHSSPGEGCAVCVEVPRS